MNSPQIHHDLNLPRFQIITFSTYNFMLMMRVRRGSVNIKIPGGTWNRDDHAF